jgi:CheY-like chemotaxis protein
MIPAGRPRVLLVEDHALIRSRVAAILAPACEIVGTAESGPAAIQMAGTLKPDVVVLDISLREMSGLEVAAHLRRAGDAIAIVFLSAYEDDELQRAAKAAGGNRYVVKSHLSDIATAVLEAFGERPRAI